MKCSTISQPNCGWPGCEIPISGKDVIGHTVERHLYDAMWSGDGIGKRKCPHAGCKEMISKESSAHHMRNKHADVIRVHCIFRCKRDQPPGSGRGRLGANFHEMKHHLMESCWEVQEKRVEMFGGSDRAKVKKPKLHDNEQNDPITRR